MNNLQLLSSCKTGSLEDVRRCIEAGADVNCYDGWPLRRAVRHNRAQVWQLLLTSDININLVNQYGLTSLHTAARFGVVSAVQNLLAVPQCLPNLKTNSGATPLCVAAKYARIEVVEILINDPRVDLNCVDFKNRSLLDLVGVSLPECDDSMKSVICELIKAEENKRKLKQKKIEAVHPEQILVRQAKEKLDKLINDLEENQKSELSMFLENLDNDKREFHMRQIEEKESFFSKIQDEERQFLYNHDIQKNIFLSKVARKKCMFERMQEDLREEYLAFKKQTFEEFREKQKEEKETLIISQNSTRSKYSRPTRWSSSSLEVAQLTDDRRDDLLSRSLEGVTVGKNKETCDKTTTQLLGTEVTSGKATSIRKHSCPPFLSGGVTTPSYGVTTYNYGVTTPSHGVTTPSYGVTTSSLSSSVSPVPSLELIPSTSLVASIPDTCPNLKALLTLNILNTNTEDTQEDEPDSPLLHSTYLTYPLKSNHVLQSLSATAKSSPRICRRNTMEVLKEESDEDASVINYNTVTGMVKVSSFNSNSSSSIESDFKLRRRSSSDSEISRNRESCWFS